MPMLVEESLRMALGVRLLRQAARHAPDGFIRTLLQEVVQTGIVLPSDASSAEVDDVTWMVWDAVISLPYASSDRPLRNILHRTVQAAVLDVLHRLGQPPLRASRLHGEQTDDRGVLYEGISSDLYDDPPHGRVRSHNPAVERVLWLRQSCNFLIQTNQFWSDADDIYIDPVAAGDGRHRDIVYEVESVIRWRFSHLAYAFVAIELHQLSIENGHPAAHSASDEASMQRALAAIRTAMYQDALADGNVDDADRFLVDALGLKFTDSAERAAGRDALWLVINRSRSWSGGRATDIKHQLGELVHCAKDRILSSSSADRRSLWTADTDEVDDVDAFYRSTVRELVLPMPEPTDPADQFVCDIDQRRRAGETALTILQDLVGATNPTTPNWNSILFQ